MLPKSKETTGNATNSWQTYEEAERSFAAIVPGKTTLDELRTLHLDPRTNPNISVLQRYQIVQTFVVNQTVRPEDLDEGVRECLAAERQCIGWEVNQTATQKKRTGNAALDMAKVRRETTTLGWRFSGLLLLKDGVVLYKLTGGQPRIHEIAATEDRLAPLQALGTKLNAINGIAVTDVRNGIKSGSDPTGHVDPVSAVRIR